MVRESSDTALPGGVRDCLQDAWLAAEVVFALVVAYSSDCLLAGSLTDVQLTGFIMVGLSSFILNARGAAYCRQ